MKKILQTLLLLLPSLSVTLAQGTKEKVTFQAEDGIEITADKYVENQDYPYIILLHQAGSSRGEFNDIADRFLKLRYNCLAVDLRAGDNANFVKNETAQNARLQHASVRLIDAAQDIRAAIEYAWLQKPVEPILLGSSYSASLAMVEGLKNPHVRAVIAFSPGEYFGDDLRVEEAIDTITKPLFIAATAREKPYVEQMMSHVPQTDYTLFSPEGGGMHGARALSNANPSKNQYWLALLLFINNLNK